MTKTTKTDTAAIVSDIESYIASYVSFADPSYSLPLALWTIATFTFPSFDAFPYLIITSATKRSGKTRLAELLSFACSNPRNFAAMTAATLFRSIEDEKPTLFFDEAETLSSEAATTMRAVLNVGYRKGQTIPRVFGNGVKEYPTFCPKVFILIGDVYDTLRDRSVVIMMRRAEAPQRFTYDAAKTAGNVLRERIKAATDARAEDIAELFASHDPIKFLNDRDEEIWMPLFVIAKLFCPERIEELSRYAVDLCADKTAEARRFTKLEANDSADQDDQNAQRLLMDLYGLMLTGEKSIASADAIDRLKAIPTAPWRRFMGEGLTQRLMANMLSRFGLRSIRIAIGSGMKNRTFARGYRREHVEEAVKHLPARR